MKVDVLQQQLQEMRNHVSTLRMKNDSHRPIQEKVEETIEAIEENHELKAEKEELHSEINELQALVDHLEGDKAEMSVEMEDLMESLEKSNVEKEVLQARLLNSERSFEDLMTENLRLSKQLEGVKSSNADDGELESVKKDLSDLQTKYDALKNESEQTLEKLRKSEETFLVLKQEKDQTSLKLTTSEENFDGWLEEQKKITTERKSELLDLQQQYDMLKAENEKLCIKLAHSEKNFDELLLEQEKLNANRKSESALKSKMLQLKQDAEDLQTENDFLKMQNQKLKKAQIDSRNEIDDVKDQIETQEMRLKRVENRNSEVNQANMDLAAENERLELRLRRANTDLKKSKMESSSLHEHVESLQSDHEKALVTQKDLSTKLKKMNLLKQRLTDMEGEYTKRVSDLQGEYTKRVSDLQQEVQLQKNIAAETKASNDSELEELAALRNENLQIRQELDEFHALKEKFVQTDMHSIYSEHQKFQEQIAFGKAALSELQEEVDNLRTANRVLQGELGKLHVENEELEDAKEQAEEAMAMIKDRYMEAVTLAMEQEEHIDVDPSVTSHDERLAFTRRRSQLAFLSDPDPAEALDIPDMLSYGNYDAELSEEHSLGLSDDYTDVTDVDSTHSIDSPRGVDSNGVTTPRDSAAD